MLKGPVKKKIDISAIYNTKACPKIEEDEVVSARMQEWFQVLQADFSPLTPIHLRMQRIALLGAMGRVFEALLYSPHKLGKIIFPFKFLDGVRSVIYHTTDPYSQLNDQQLCLFISHVYELCRAKLTMVTGSDHYPSLSIPLNMAEREEGYFKAALEYTFTEGAILRKKIKQRLHEKLNENVLLLNEIVLLLRDNPGFLVTEDTPICVERANVVRATVVGALMAWISLDTTTLLRGECYLREEDSKKTTLSKGSIRSIEKAYGEYVIPGKNYRHKNAALHNIVTQYQIGAISAVSWAANIEIAIQKGASREVITEFVKWEKHPWVLKNEAKRDPIVGHWLVVAASQGNLALVPYFQNRCQRNTWRAFALTNAAQNGHQAVVEGLLASGMPISVDLVKYALVLARENNQMNMVKLLETKMTELFPTIVPLVTQNASSSDDEEQALMDELTQHLQELMSSSDSEPELDDNPPALIFGYPAAMPANLIDHAAPNPALKSVPKK